MTAPRRVLLSWSSGKDAAWALHILRHDPETTLVGLLTSFNAAFDRVAMHAVRRALVEAQARAAGLPLWSVPLPWPCSNADYEARMAQVCADALDQGVTHVAFGDLFLDDIRAYRERQLAGTGLAPLFPLWHPPDGTTTLARSMQNAGLCAVLTCVDPSQLDPAFAGRAFDESLLADLPPDVDPCGERGEFHTFCHDGPMFREPIPITVGPAVTRDGFCFVDLLPTGSFASDHSP